MKPVMTNIVPEIVIIAVGQTKPKPRLQWDVFVNDEWIGYTHAATPKAAAKSKIKEKGIVIGEKPMKVQVYRVDNGRLAFEAKVQQLWEKKDAKGS